MHKRAAASAGILAVAALVSLSACSADGEGGGSAGSEAAGDPLVVGVKYDQPGLGLDVDGEITGFDADMAREIAERLGRDIEFTEAVSAQRETLIENGTVDMVLATYTINEERDQVIDWAGPYFHAGQDILVPVDNPKNITTPEDLDEKILCAVEGSNSTQRLRDEYAQQAQLYPAQTYSECIELLSSGTVDAVSTDDVILAGFAAQPQYEGQFKVLGNPFSEEPYGVGIPQGSDLCEPINDAINEIIEDGTWDELVEKNLGSSYTPDPATNPPTPRPCSDNI